MPPKNRAARPKRSIRAAFSIRESAHDLLAARQTGPLKPPVPAAAFSSVIVPPRPPDF